jgi:outer membrane protein TolC
MGYFLNRSYALKRRVRLARIFIRKIPAITALTFCVHEAVLSQPAQTLSIDMALNAATERSLHLGAHDATASSSREMAIVASQLPDPVLRMSLDNVPVEGGAQWSLQQDFMTMQTVGLMQTFVPKKKRNALADRYEQEARLADTEKVVELAALQRAAVLAWLDRYYRERTLELLSEQRAEASLLVDTTEAVYRSGQVSQMDIFSAQSEAAALEDRIKEAEIELSNAVARLERWIGESAQLPLAPLPALMDIELQTYDGTAQAELAWLAQQEELALAETRVARMSRRPDWNVELMYGKRGPAFEDMLSLGVSVPLQLGRKDKQDRELAASLSRLENVQRLRAEQSRDYRLQIQTWLSSWRGTQDRLNRYDTALLPLAQERTEAALSAYRGNRLALSEVLDARQSEIELRLQRANLEWETAGLWAQLRFLMPVTDMEQLSFTPVSANVPSQEQ